MSISSKHLKHHTIGWLLGIYALEAIAANLAHPITPNLLESLNMPNYMFGVVFAAMSVTNFAFSPFWGSLCHYISARKILLISCVGYALGQVIFGFSSSQVMLTIGRLISGMFVSGISIGTTYYVIQYSSEEKRAQNITASITTFTVSGTFGFFLGGYIGNTSLVTPFIAQCSLLVICGVLFYVFLNENDTQEETSVRMLIKESNPIKAFMQIKPYLSITITILFAIVLCVSTASTSLTQSFMYYVQNTLRLSPFINGMTKGIVGMLSLAVNFTLTLWILKQAHVERKLVLIVSLLSASLGLMIITQQSSIGFIVFGIFAMIIDTIQISMLQDRNAHYASHENQGAMLGMHNAMKGLGMIMGSLISGFIYDMHPIYPFAFSMILYALGAGMTGLLAKERKQYS